MGDELTACGILLIVKGDENVGGLAEMLGVGVPGEEKVPNEEQKFHEGPELYSPPVPSALHVFVETDAEVETNGDQVSDGVGSGFRGSSCYGDDGVHDSQGGGRFALDGGILEPVGIELPREALVDPGVCLRVGWFSGVGQTIQEVA